MKNEGATKRKRGRENEKKEGGCVSGRRKETKKEGNSEKERKKERKNAKKTGLRQVSITSSSHNITSHHIMIVKEEGGLQMIEY